VLEVFKKNVFNNSNKKPATSFHGNSTAYSILPRNFSPFAKDFIDNFASNTTMD
jgi:hypothetical protein